MNQKATTQVFSVTETLLWTIEDITLLDSAHGSVVTSPTFKVGPYEFKVNFHLGGYHSTSDAKLQKDCKCGNNGFISVYLSTNHTFRMKFLLNVFSHKDVALVVSDGTIAESVMFSGTDLVPFTYGWAHYYVRETLMKTLAASKNYCIKLQFEVTAVLDTTTAMRQMAAAQSNMEKEHQMTMSSLLTSGLRSDVCVKVQDKEWELHKVILAARSPVFKAMFEHKMLETESSQVTLPDLTAITAPIILSHIYTGRFDEKMVTTQLLPDLLAAASVLQLGSLVDWCSERIASDLNADTVAEYMLLADRLHVQPLKDRCFEFVNAESKRLNALVNSEAFQNLDKALLHELIQSYADPAQYFSKKRKAMSQDPPAASGAGSGSGSGAGSGSGMGSGAGSGATEEKKGHEAEPVTLYWSHIVKADVPLLRVVDLKNALCERGLPVSGIKQDLVDRLTNALEV